MKEKESYWWIHFFKSQFSYCPLSRMFHSHTLNNEINRLSERRLCIIYNDNTSTFNAILEIDNSVSVCDRNIQVLATELYKFVNGLSPMMVRDCFKLNKIVVCNAKTKFSFYSRSVCTVLHGTELLSRKFGNLCKMIRKTFHHSQPSKKAIKQWTPHTCPCHIYISIRLVSFNIWIQKSTFSSRFSFYICMYLYMYVFIIVLHVCIYFCIYYLLCMYALLFVYVCICIKHCILDVWLRFLILLLCPYSVMAAQWLFFREKFTFSNSL